MHAHFRTGYSLTEREREIAVCIINSKWHSIYPTNAHERAGKAAGLPADKVEAILSGLPTAFDAALTEAKVPHEGHVYKGANHGFHNDTTPRYDEAAATSR